MAEDRQNGSTTGRDRHGRFAAGNPGRPAGSRHKATIATQALLDGEAEALTRKAIDMALGGDPGAMRICIERLIPVRKDAPVSFTLPPIEGADDLAEASAAVLDAVAAGDLTPSEAQAIAALLQAHGRTLELTDIEARLKRLEQENKT